MDSKPMRYEDLLSRGVVKSGSTVSAEGLYGPPSEVKSETDYNMTENPLIGAKKSPVPPPLSQQSGLQLTEKAHLASPGNTPQSESQSTVSPRAIYHRHEHIRHDEQTVDEMKIQVSIHHGSVEQ